ncbi:MAG: F0F1 ATP synthase subunit delta [Treponema sp.]|nr:F0F1 ATP synthase subunit delta [Treponema sp.]
MFAPERWAQAFVNTCGSDAEDAFVLLKILNEWVKKLPGAVFGGSCANHVEQAIGKAAAKLGIEQSKPLDTACCFIELMVKRNVVSNCGSIIAEIEKLLDAEKKILPAVLEYVIPPAKELEDSVCAVLKKTTGAREIRLEKKPEPSLIGGFRLRYGGMVADASLLSQLKKMEAMLAEPAASGNWAGNISNGALNG